jgi:hypothetical protein
MKLLSTIAIAILFLTVPTRGVEPKEGGFRTPLMRTVEPYKASAGDQVTISGENLDKARVAEVYISDGKENTPVTMVTQEDKKLVVKLPATAKPGRYSFVVMLTDNPPMFIEEPVKITIE